jgi:hypothetical protein
VREFFDKDYMKDFAGIEIDPKFTDSSFQSILNADIDQDGLKLEEFIEVIVPKEDTQRKTEPEFYPEQDL